MPGASMRALGLIVCNENLWGGEFAVAARFAYWFAVGEGCTFPGPRTLTWGTQFRAGTLMRYPLHLLPEPSNSAIL